MNHNDTYQPIPLEERLRRFSAGETGSPQFVRCILRDFGRLPLIPTLEKMNYLRERTRVRQAMELLHISGPTGRLTHGDAAVLIRRSRGRTPAEDEAEALSRLISACFTGLEVYCLLEKKLERKRLLDMFPGQYRSIVDYAELNLKDLSPYLTGKDVEAGRAFLRQTGCSGSEKLSQLFRELRQHMGVPSDSSLFDGEDVNGTEPLATAEAAKPLLELFVYPVAKVQLQAETERIRSPEGPAPGRALAPDREGAGPAARIHN